MVPRKYLSDPKKHDVQSAYAARAGEYADRLGSMDAVHPADRHLVLQWAQACDGPVLDAGCGPGHWTDFLHRSGIVVEGIDVVPEFIAEAKARFPSASFHVGTLAALDVEDHSLAGVLAWYSAIHATPEVLDTVLHECARVLRPGGSLLLGFFEGPVLERFPHAVVAAYRWPVPQLSAKARRAGFEIQEVHTRTDPGVRPHGAIIAARPGAQ